MEGRIGLIDPDFDASAITTGTIDPARLPPTEGVVVASGGITTLTPTQQATIVEGTLVILGAGAGVDAGKSYRYAGSGSKTSLASYVEQQTSVSWTSVTGKPDLEPALGNPGAGNWFLKTVSAVRSWVQLGALAFLNTIADAQVATGAAIAWGKISKSGAVASDVGAVSSVGNGSITGSLTLGTPTGGARFLLIDGALTQTVGLALGSAGNTRWILDRDSLAAFEIRAYDASGTAIDAPVSIGNAAGSELVVGRPFRVSQLSGAGTRAVAVDSTGKLVATTQSALWADTAKTFNANSTWLSALSASSASRKIAANTWVAGRVLEFKYKAAMPTFFGASTPDFEFTIGPNGTSGAPYYEYIYGKTATATAELMIDIVVTVTCASAGASGQFNIQWKYIAGYSGGASIVSCGNNSSSQLTTMDTTVDKWIDLWIPSSGNVVGLYSSAKWLI